jgi:hypothetical protein
MSSTIGLISAKIDGSTSVVSSAASSWDTMADGVPCVDGSIACSGASADSNLLRGAG